MDPLQAQQTHGDERESAKARLFGEDDSGVLRKKLAMAQFMAGLDLPSQGEESEPEGEAETQPVAGAYPAEPVCIGRFAILRKLGQGGMGVVYAAYDESLDRKIALKLMRSSLSKDERGRARMLREAQALARLSHPNVVQVFEIGEWEGHDFLAMEFIDGRTLREWLRERARSWEELLPVLIETGRGLAAAHEAGLVHRDFKPANVLVALDGRPRVLDFGLARASDESGGSFRVSELIETGEHSVGPSQDSAEDLTRSSGAFDELLTATGALLGTPAYMAPEQHLGQRASELSDQFSFCLVLYEALYGERPFESTTRNGYTNAVLSGKIAEAPAGASVPAWLRAVVCRGLSVRPEERWPSMDELLAELARERGQRWRRAGVAAGAIAAFAAALALTPSEPELCSIDASVVEDTWGAAQREALAEAFAATGSPVADSLFVQVSGALDAYAEGLVAGQREACAARWVENRQTDAQLELRMACLEQRERELGAIVETLAELDRRSVVRSPALLRGLGDLGMCAAIEELERGVPVPKDARTAEAIADAREDIARAHAARSLGRLDDAELLTAELRARAELLDHAPLVGEVELLAGANAWGARDPQRAKQALREAISIATQIDDARLGAMAWHELASVYSGTHGDPADALVAAAAYADRLGDQPAHRFALLHTRGDLLISQGKYGEALEQLDHALALGEAGFPGSELEQVNLLVTRSTALAGLGRRDEANAELERVLALGVRVGAHNPGVADALFNFAVSDLEDGELARAGARFEQAMRTYEAIYGPDYPYIGHARLGLANIAIQEGALGRAREQVEAAIALFEADEDGERLDLVHALDAAAELALLEGQPERALELLRRALTRFAPGEVLSEAHDQAYLRVRLARVLARQGQHEDALSELEAAFAVFDEGEDSLDVVEPLIERAAVLRELGEASRARADLSRALELTPTDCGRAQLAAAARISLLELEPQHPQRDALLRDVQSLLQSLPSDNDLVARARTLTELTG